MDGRMSTSERKGREGEPHVGGDSGATPPGTQAEPPRAALDAHAGAADPSASTEMLKTYFEHLFANSRDVMNLFSITKGKIILLNAAAEKTTGYSFDELQSLPIDALYPPEEHAKLALAFQQLASTGYSTDKLSMYVRNGELRDIWVRSYVVQREPEIVCIVHTIDITDENRKRDRELRDAKLATLGEASATLAHELKNALQSMQFSLATLRSQIPPSGAERAANSLARIERAAAHMDEVISGIEKSANEPKPGSAHVSVPASVQNAAFLMHGYLAAKGVEYSSHFGHSLPLVWCNKSQLEQILIALFKNAAQAMSSRRERKLHVATVNAAEGLRVDVCDTGGGLPAEVQAHLFEAFRTTKPAGIGQGLGLATAKQLAVENGLELTFTSEPNVGTTFSIRFPIAQGAVSARESQLLAGRLVLLVGDDAGTVELATITLESAGARVLHASTAPEGLSLLRVHAFGAIVCDDAMYPVAGREFVRQARELYRGPVCLVVGERPESIDSFAEADSVVTKPMEARALVQTLSALLV
jgi:PAS domain S-box-containing protein